MTVKDLIEALSDMPPDACIVFRNNENDDSDYGSVDVFHEDGEVFIDVHGDDEP